MVWTGSKVPKTPRRIFFADAFCVVLVGSQGYAREAGLRRNDYFVRHHSNLPLNLGIITCLGTSSHHFASKFGVKGQL